MVSISPCPSLPPFNINFLIVFSFFWIILTTGCIIFFNFNCFFILGCNGLFKCSCNFTYLVIDRFIQSKECSILCGVLRGIQLHYLVTFYTKDMCEQHVATLPLLLSLENNNVAISKMEGLAYFGENEWKIDWVKYKLIQLFSLNCPTTKVRLHLFLSSDK